MNINMDNFKNKNATIMKSKSIFDDDSNSKYRYLLLRQWDEKKDKIAVILHNPSDANDLLYDTTTMRVMNYVITKMSEVGGIYFLNLYSVIEKDSNLVVKQNKENPEDHKKWMQYALENSTRVFAGWGSNKNNLKVIKELKELLNQCKFDYIYKFTDINDKHTHPSRCTIESIKKIKIENI